MSVELVSGEPFMAPAFCCQAGVRPITVGSGAGYCGQLRHSRLISAAEFTATRVNGSTT
jgi:hypothetical protein